MVRPPTQDEAHGEGLEPRIYHRSWKAPKPKSCSPSPRVFYLNLLDICGMPRDLRMRHWYCLCEILPNEPDSSRASVCNALPVVLICMLQTSPALRTPLPHALFWFSPLCCLEITTALLLWLLFSCFSFVLPPRIKLNNSFSFVSSPILELYIVNKICLCCSLFGVLTSIYIPDADENLLVSQPHLHLVLSDYFKCLPVW